MRPVDGRMDVTRDDAAVLTYNLAVAFSGSWVSTRLGIQNRWVLVGVIVVLAVVWTIYFRLRMLPRLAAEE
jgi:hypothetical protein